MGVFESSFIDPDGLFSDLDGAAEYGFHPGKGRDGGNGADEIVFDLIPEGDDPIIVGKEIFRRELVGLETRPASQFLEGTVVLELEPAAEGDPDHRPFHW